MKEIITLFNNEEGNTSIFLIITFTALIFLIFGLLDIARIISSKNQLEDLGLIAITSLMCDYNRELKNDYDLFATVYQNKFEIEDEIFKCIKKNINGFKINKISNVEIELVNSISLNNYYEIKRQIINNYKSKTIEESVYEIFFDEDKLDEISSEKVSVPDEEEYERVKGYAEKDNREEIKNKIQNANNDEDIIIDKVLLNGLDDNYDLSDSKNESKKIINRLKKISDFSMVDEMLINEYILDTFYYKTYGSEQNRNRVFDAEIEFILTGKNSQNENINNVKNEIMLILFPEKLIEVYNDEEKKNEAELISQAICGWWASEIGVTICKNAILNYWALDLCHEDYQKLIRGESICPKIFLREMNYKDFLKVLLFVENKEKKIDNMINLIDINMKTYNYNFSMKTSYSKFKIQISAKEKYIFATRRCVPKSFKFLNDVNIRKEITYGY